MKPTKRKSIARRFPGALVVHAGRAREVIAELNLTAGTIAIRLQGCKRRKVYQVADLALFKPGTPQLALQLEFESK